MERTAKLMVMSPDEMIEENERKRRGRRDERVREVVEKISDHMLASNLSQKFVVVPFVYEDDDSVVEEALAEYRSAGYGAEVVGEQWIYKNRTLTVRVTLPGYVPPSEKSRSSWWPF